MSVASTLQSLRTRLLTIDPTPEPAPRKVYADPKESVSLGECPCIVLALAPGVQDRWSMEAVGLARHDYTVAIYIFLGPRNAPLPELHSRALPWSEALMRVLAADVTLAGTIDQLGDGQSPQLYTYTTGPIAWADGVYWGLKCQLPVVEKPVMTMG